MNERRAICHPQVYRIADVQTGIKSLLRNYSAIFIITKAKITNFFSAAVASVTFKPGTNFYIKH